MKNFTIYFLIIILGGLEYSFSPKDKKIPITTSSETARTLYNEAWDAFDNFRINQVKEKMLEAVKKDSDFFMANYTLALFSFTTDNNKFKQFGERATNCNAKLSKGELHLKDAMSKLLVNPNSDLTDIGRELVKIYPKDVFAYYQLSFFQGIIKNVDGQIATIKSAIENVDNSAPLYNQLGYIYMRNERYEEAAIAFDKYIELEPNHPNPYDSKGEYFTNVKDYRSAYENYMKAYKLDSASKWRLKRAMDAKAIADSLDNK